MSGMDRTDGRMDRTDYADGVPHPGSTGQYAEGYRTQVAPW